MTNYSFLTVTELNGDYHVYGVDEVSSYHIQHDIDEYEVKVRLKCGEEWYLKFSTMEEAKNSIKIIGDIRCQ